jgi:SAM-dependent methyltransferase
MKGRLLAIARRMLPKEARRRAVRSTRWPLVGFVRFGDLRRVTPISRQWGYDRGTPIDRYYIERFLAAHATDIRGRVLEVAGNVYTLRFGGDRVAQSDVLHDEPGNPLATVVADLARADHLPAGTYDCIICTQTLHLIYDVRAAIKSLHRILKPGAILLATVPGISQISRADMNRHGDHWRFTTASVLRLLAETFPADTLMVKAHGNVLTATAFLYGLTTEELRAEELDHFDPDYEVCITVRAVKSVSRE